MTRTTQIEGQCVRSKQEGGQLQTRKSPQKKLSLLTP